MQSTNNQKIVIVGKQLSTIALYENHLERQRCLKHTRRNQLSIQLLTAYSEPTRST